MKNRAKMRFHIFFIIGLVHNLIYPMNYHFQQKEPSLKIIDNQSVLREDTSDLIPTYFGLAAGFTTEFVSKVAAKNCIRCMKCEPVKGLGFTGKKEYDRHRYISHPCICYECKPKTTFTNRQEYGKHYYNVHRDNGSKRRTCHKCVPQLQFSNLKKYCEHYNKAHRSKKRKIDNALPLQSNKNFDSEESNKRFQTDTNITKKDQYFQADEYSLSAAEIEQILNDSPISIPNEIVNIWQ